MDDLGDEDANEVSREVIPRKLLQYSKTCGICLKPSPVIYPLNPDTQENVCQSLLLIIPSANEELSACEDCFSSWNLLSQLFIRLSTLHSEFNELRMKIGRTIINKQSESKKKRNSIFLSSHSSLLPWSSFESWEQSISNVSHVFPSCLHLHQPNVNNNVDVDSIEVKIEVDNELNLVNLEDNHEKDAKLKMTPVVLLERLRQSAIKRGAADSDDEFFPSFDDNHNDNFDAEDDDDDYNSRRGNEKPKPKSRRYRPACSICPDETFTKFASLRQHYEQFHGIESLTSLALPCSHCDSSFRDPPALRRHQISVHFLGSLASGDAQCQFCLKFFPNLDLVKSHQQFVHFRNGKGSSAPVGIKCFTCKHTSCRSPEALKAHETSEEHKRAIDSLRTIHCNVCRINFDGNLEALKSHLNSPDGDHKKEKESLDQLEKKNYFCIPCRLPFTSAKEFKFHNKPSLAHKNTLSTFRIQRAAAVEDSNSTQHTCQFCGEIFPLVKDLVIHRRMSHADLLPKMFPCNICGNEFTRQNNLKRHKLALHLGEQAICPTCGKSYPSSAALDSHIKFTHLSGRGKGSGEGYSSDCLLCPATFKKPNLLRKHLCLSHPKEHLEAKGHVHCTLCYYTFPQKGGGELLERHMKSHAHLRCSLCPGGKYFQTRHGLREHEDRIHKSLKKQ